MKTGTVLGKNSCAALGINQVSVFKVIHLLQLFCDSETTRQKLRVRCNRVIW